MAVANGTLALWLACRAAGLGPGDRFIAQQLSYLHRTPVVAVVTKTDKVGPEQLMAQLVAVTALGEEVLGPENGGEGE